MSFRDPAKKPRPCLRCLSDPSVDLHPILRAASPLSPDPFLAPFRCIPRLLNR